MRTVPGKWLLEHTLGKIDLRARKWIALESRGAAELDTAFLAWLSRRRSDRPFFAFLNYFDAHEPYVPPPEYEGCFGIRPTSAADYEFLMDFVGVVKSGRKERDILMARDWYDDSIAYLDEQLGRLLRRLESERLLDNTVVIITSDHGEGFGDHGTVGHSYGVYLEEIGVPLVILAPGAPASRAVRKPVSLRDLPATVVDLLGLSSVSPFPGGSLAAHWRDAPGQTGAPTSLAFSEQVDSTALESDLPRIPGRSTFQMSVIAAGHHYIRTGKGKEQLFDLTADRYERVDLMAQPAGESRVNSFRRLLLDLLSHDTGSAEAEKGYLAHYRQSLKSLVDTASPARLVGAR